MPSHYTNIKLITNTGVGTTVVEYRDRVKVGCYAYVLKFPPFVTYHVYDNSNKKSVAFVMDVLSVNQHPFTQSTELQFIDLIVNLAYFAMCLQGCETLGHYPGRYTK